MSIFVHKPGLWLRFWWALAEMVGALPRSYLAALTDTALLEKAEMLIRLGDQTKAQRALDMASRRAIEDPRQLGQLANLQLRNGNKEIARRAHLRAAQAYLQLGRVDEATHVLQQILAVARDCLEARLALGQIAEGRYGHEEAVAHYLEAVKVLTARQEWEGVQELLERVRQLQRVKSALESDTQMMPPLLGAGPMPVVQAEIMPANFEPSFSVSEDSRATMIDTASPVARRPIADAPTVRNHPSVEELRISESETVADRPSPLRAAPSLRSSASPRAPSTVIVEPDLTFPDTTDPVQMPPRTPAAIPSTFVRHAPSAPPPPPRRPDDQVRVPTDIVMRDQLPAELMIKIDTAVDFKPPRSVVTPGAPLPPGPLPPELVDPTPVIRARDPTRAAAERRPSVWDRAIVQGPREAITLNVGPEPEPLVSGQPSVLRRASTGISSALSAFITGMNKDGGGSKS